MSKTRAYVSLVVGALGVVVWLALVVVVWRTLPPVGTQVAQTAASVRASVAGVHGRLATVDDALVQTSVTIEAFREEHEGDLDAVREERRRLEAQLAPVVGQIRDDLEAVRDVVRSIDNLLQALDLPFLRTARRAGAERMEAIVERVPRFGEEERDLGLDLAPARRLVGEARERVAAWRASLDALDADLGTLETRAPRLVTVLCVVVTVLALWSLVGQICLLRAGKRGLRRDVA